MDPGRIGTPGPYGVPTRSLRSFRLWTPYEKLDFGARSHGLHAGCLRFIGPVTRIDARLASGCGPGSTRWDWLPTGFRRKVSDLLLLHLFSLSQALPDARTTKLTGTAHLGKYISEKPERRAVSSSAIRSAFVTQFKSTPPEPPGGQRLLGRLVLRRFRRRPIPAISRPKPRCNPAAPAPRRG